MSSHEKYIPPGPPRIIALVLLSSITWTLLSFVSNYSITEKARVIVDEICDNAIDDDLDGLIDLNDPDCTCESTEPVSLIPNPSFEDLECCPDNRSQLNCATSWIQASVPTTDLIHMCNWMGWDEFPPPLPFPDGEGIMGFRDGRVPIANSRQPDWKEYAGSCLLAPLEANNVYRFEFDVGFVNSLASPPINITFFGTTDCANLPFGDGAPDFGCPTNGPGWKKLGSSLVSGGAGNKWVKTFIEVVPEEDIAAIAIGPDCPHVVTDVSTYYFFDNLLLADIRFFQLQIEELSHPCNETFSLGILDEPGFTFQWYKDGIALIGETQAELSQIFGEGLYQVRILEDGLCRISNGYQHTVPAFSEQISRTICKDDVYLFGNQELSESGTYINTFKTADNCDSIVTLTLEELGEFSDTVRAKILAGTTYEIDRFRFDEAGNHLVTLTSSLGCDSLVLLQLEFFQFFIPNVFSPNQDGINDVFKVYGGNGLIDNRDLIIFDRWGAKIYQGPEWDGTYKGQQVNPGVFIYRGRLIMSDGTEQEVSGSVTVVR